MASGLGGRVALAIGESLCMTVPGTEYAIQTLLPQFQAAGRALRQAGLITAGTGNMSVWTPDGVLITREGADLGALNAGDLCLVGRTTRQTSVNPSLDTPIHRVVYVLGAGRALIHARPPAALRFAEHERELRPADSDGARLLGAVLVLISARDIVRQVADNLAERPAVMVRGHGCYVRGVRLDEALHHVLVLEESARRLDSSGGPR
jgi:L-fuculose-phosphate aldolase